MALVEDDALLGSRRFSDNRCRSSLVDQKPIFIFRGAGGNRYGELILGIPVDMISFGGTPAIKSESIGLPIFAVEISVPLLPHT